MRKFKPTKFVDKTKEHPTPLLTLKIATTFSMLKPFTAKGAYLGLYSYGLRPPEFLLDEAIEAIKEVGADHFVLGTDLGGYKVSYPAPEYRRLLVLLLEAGISEADIEKMARINPERLILGHRPKKVIDAVKEVLETRGTMLGTSHPSEYEVAEMLTEAVPCLELVRFGNSGTEVIMSAIRLARAYTGKEKDHSV